MGKEPNKDGCFSTLKDSLLERLAAHEIKAASELVDKYYNKIFLYMRRMGHNRQVSEDLTQECFLQAWKNIGQLRNSKALSSWLYRIASNVSKGYWRKNRNTGNLNIEDIDFADSKSVGADEAYENEVLEMLKNSVIRLPGNLKETIILHYMQHLTIAEAAEAMGIREGTFKSRLNKALKLIKKDLNDIEKLESG